MLRNRSGFGGLWMRFRGQAGIRLIGSPAIRPACGWVQARGAWPAALLSSALAIAILGFAAPQKGPSSPQMEGLAAFRTHDSLGRFCAGCHAPDGLDIAEGDYSEADILRRARRHLDNADAEAATAMILRLRAQLGIHRASNLTMQPGGAVLPGQSAEERDEAFGQELRKLVPALFDKNASFDDISRQLMAVSLPDLRIGIEMSPLSQDGFHDPAKGSVNEWLPENGVPADAKLYASQDAYLANPSWQTLGGLLDEVKSLPRARTAADQISRSKYMSLLILQHQERQAAGWADPSPMPSDFLSSRNLNPFWEVGDDARLAANQPLSSLGLDEDVLAEKKLGPMGQVRELELPWMWLGFCFDPTLLHTRMRDETGRAPYFIQALADQGPYPWHLVFVLGRKTIEQYQAAKLHPQTEKGTGFQLEFDPLIYHTDVAKLSNESPESQKKFTRAFARLFVWAVHLQIQSIQETGRVSYPESDLAQLKQMSPMLSAQGYNPKELTTDLTSAIAKAKRL